MRGLICGYGEVGKGVHEAFKKYHQFDTYDLKNKSMLNGPYDILIITFPYFDEFVEEVGMYQLIAAPKVTLIFSTVPIGTTRQINNAVHCPIEGKHPNLGDSIRKFTRFVGYNNDTALRYAEQFFYEADIPKIFPVFNSDCTELMKLQSTTNYGINIEYARFVKRLCDKCNVPYEFVKIYNSEYNDLYEGTGYKRYILEPPQGKIGGHCILQNLPLLKETMYDDFIKILEDNNV